MRFEEQLLRDKLICVHRPGTDLMRINPYLIEIESRLFYVSTAF